MSPNLSYPARLLAALTLTCMPLAALAEIEVHDAYAIAATPQAMSGAAFMVIHNHGGAPDRLLSVRSDVAARTELHTHVQGADGMMQMVHVEEGWALPTEGEILLTRGGDHVMFMGLTSPFADGLVIDLTLVFEVAGEITVPVPVDLSRLTEQPMDHGADHGTMDHGAMDHGADHGAMDHGADHGAMDHGADQNAAVIDQAGLTDEAAIAAVLQAVWETPEAPLAVTPIVVEGDHALASWAQGDRGGRALLRRVAVGWEVVLCGGADLQLPGFLTQHGVGDLAGRLSARFNDAEAALGSDKVALSSSFEGIVMVAGAHGH